MTTIRFLTANLLHDRADPSALARLIEVERVDIACLQELGPRQAEAVREVLPHGLLDPGWGARRFHGMGIAARRPIEVQRLALPYRDALVTALEPQHWPQAPAAVQVAGVHLVVPRSGRVRNAPALRLGQLRGLLAHLDAAGQQPVVLAGDLNSAPRWLPYRALTTRLRDLVLEHGRNAGSRPRPTWAPRPGWPRLIRIDHVFGRGVTPLEARVIPLPGSDHAAVLVEVDLHGALPRGGA